MIVPAFAAAEADYLILERLGVDAELRFLEDLGESYRLDSLDGGAMLTAAKVCRRYRELEPGLVDASVVVLAERWSTRFIATLDERHFRAIRPLQGGSFTLLPADA